MMLCCLLSGLRSVDLLLVRLWTWFFKLQVLTCDCSIVSFGVTCWYTLLMKDEQNAKIPGWLLPFYCSLAWDGLVVVKIAVMEVAVATVVPVIVVIAVVAKGVVVVVVEDSRSRSNVQTLFFSGALFFAQPIPHQAVKRRLKPGVPFGVDLLIPKIGGGARSTNKDGC